MLSRRKDEFTNGRLIRINSFSIQRLHGDTVRRTEEVCAQVGDSHLSTPLSTAFMELVEGEGYLGVIATFLQPLLKSLYASLLKYRVHVKNLFLEFDSTGLNAFIYSFSLSPDPSIFDQLSSFLRGRTKYSNPNSRVDLTLE